MNSHRYSFLVSSDEIMFLRMDVKHVVEKGKVVMCEPRLHYSHPMQLTDPFDAEQGTITVRLGLLYLFWLILRDDKGCQLPEELGNCLNYAVFMDDGEDLKIRPSCVPEAASRRAKKAVEKEVKE